MTVLVSDEVYLVYNHNDLQAIFDSEEKAHRYVYNCNTPSRNFHVESVKINEVIYD